VNETLPKVRWNFEIYFPTIHLFGSIRERTGWVEEAGALEHTQLMFKQGIA
jgi:hypothetical protein